MEVYPRSFLNSFLDLGSVKFTPGSLGWGGGDIDKNCMSDRLTGPRAGLDVLETRNLMPLQEFKPRIVQPVVTTQTTLTRIPLTCYRKYRGPPFQAWGVGSAHHSLLPTVLDRPHDALFSEPSFQNCEVQSAHVQCNRDIRTSLGGHDVLTMDHWWGFSGNSTQI